jgi:hypothetical protein
VVLIANEKRKELNFLLYWKRKKQKVNVSINNNYDKYSEYFLFFFVFGRNMIFSVHTQHHYQAQWEFFL